MLTSVRYSSGVTVCVLMPNFSFIAAYLSPEVVLEQRFEKPMDIWSVGCVVVEMATGKVR